MAKLMSQVNFKNTAVLISAASGELKAVTQNGKENKKVYICSVRVYGVCVTTARI